MFIIPYYIKLLVHYGIGKQIRENGLVGKAVEFMKLHEKKSGTPTMGGGIILLLVFLMVIISIWLQKFGFTNYSLFNQKETYLSLFTLLTIWIVWAVDDYLNIKSIWKTKWLSAKVKMIALLIFATLWAFWFYYKLWWNVTNGAWQYVRTVAIPFWQSIQIGWWFIPLFIFIIVATSNSVNITDWLDGLAGWLLLFSYAVYAYITYTQWLFLLSTLCVTVIWALIAFLWFNIKPAQFYMGDIWSLALWANLWIMAMLTNTLFVLVIVWALFIFETISVLIQITSKKLRKGKKVFKIAPFHHHLEACGRSEETVVFRLWLIGIILAVVWVIFYHLQ
jgi:phospho-N-acetylmuramoyl-pentapeptide-transferase